MKRWSFVAPLLLACGCERSLLHSLPSPLPANDQGGGGGGGGGACAPELAPSDLVVSVSEDRVQLSWIDNADGALSFVVERRAGDGSFEVLTVAIAETSHVDTEGERDTVYGCRVRGEAEGRRTAESGVVEALTYPAPPGAPDAVGGDGTIALSWGDTNPGRCDG